MEDVLSLLSRTATWLLIAVLGAVAFLTAMFALLGGTAGLAARTISGAVALAAGMLAWWLFRRVHLAARQKGPIAAALRSLPPGAVVRSGRARVLPSTFWLSCGLFLGGAFLAVLGAGFGAPTEQALVLVTCTSAIAGGLIGLGGRHGLLEDVLTALSLPVSLLLLMGVIAVTGGITGSELPDVVGAIGLVMVVTATPVIVGFGLGRLIRSRFDEGRRSSGGHEKPRLARGLARATERDPAAAIVWTYPGSTRGDERRALDRELLASAGYDILVEERGSAQGSTAAGVAGLLLSQDVAPSHDGWVRVLYRRRAAQPDRAGAVADALATGTDVGLDTTSAPE
jgi:hypothetical protein